MAKNFSRKFRRLQLTAIILNEAFKGFLTFFPTILFSLVAMLLFGSIKLLPIDPKSNIMFPLCGIRCGFEALTPLQMSGNVSQESEKVLKQWQQHIEGEKTRRDKKAMKMMLNSFKRILCTAGSLYTFEHSIVLCSINNCIQLTLNLLVTFGKHV